MLRPILLVSAVALLTGCAELGYAGYGTPSRYPDSRRAEDRREVDVRRTREYRRLDSDAAAYARLVDRALRLDSRQERAIRDVLATRTERLLLNTRARDHAAVYPFPRDERTRATRDFWRAADRDIERLLDRRDRDRYREFARTGRVDDRRMDNRRDERGRDDGRRGRGNARGHGRR